MYIEAERYNLECDQILQNKKLLILFKQISERNSFFDFHTVDEILSKIEWLHEFLIENVKIASALFEILTSVFFRTN